MIEQLIQSFSLVVFNGIEKLLCRLHINAIDVSLKLKFLRKSSKVRKLFKFKF